LLADGFEVATTGHQDGNKRAARLLPRSATVVSEFDYGGVKANFRYQAVKMVEIAMLFQGWPSMEFAFYL